MSKFHIQFSSQLWVSLMFFFSYPYPKLSISVALAIWRYTFKMENTWKKRLKRKAPWGLQPCPDPEMISMTFGWLCQSLTWIQAVTQICESARKTSTWKTHHKNNVNRNVHSCSHIRPRRWLTKSRCKGTHTLQLCSLCASPCIKHAPPIQSHLVQLTERTVRLPAKSWSYINYRLNHNALRSEKERRTDALRTLSWLNRSADESISVKSH